MSVVEPPIRTNTPLSDAGESSSELVASLLNQQQQQQQQLQQQQLQQELQQQQQLQQQSQASAGGASDASRPRMMSKAAHDAIFGRAASTSSHLSPGQGPMIPIVAHEDDSLGYALEQRRQGGAINPRDQVEIERQRVANVQAAQNLSASRHTRNNGRSPRLMPVQVPSSIPPNVVSYPPSASLAAAPTALAIMRRRRSNSLGDHHSGSSSGRRGNSGLDASGSGRSRSGSGSASGGSSRQSSSAKSSKNKPSPKIGSKGAQDVNLDYNATIQQQQQQQQAYGSVPQAHQLLTAMRYNSSLHSTLGGYPMGTPTQLNHPSITLELIARDRARWEADYYGAYGLGGGMDYGYDGAGGFYGATPSFRSMSQGLRQGVSVQQQQQVQQDGLAGLQQQQAQQVQQGLNVQQSQQSGQGLGRAASQSMAGLQHQQQARQQGQGLGDLGNFYQPKVQSQQQQSQQQVQQQQLEQQVQQQQQQLQQQVQQQQLNLEGRPAATTSNLSQDPVVALSQQIPSRLNLSPNTRRAYQQRDYKTDRVWQEDDHTSRPDGRNNKKTNVKADNRVWQEDDHTSRPERRNTDKTSNKEDDKNFAEAPLPSVPKLKTEDKEGIPEQLEQEAPRGRAELAPRPAQQQGGQLQGQVPDPQHLQQPRLPQDVPQGRLSIDDYDIRSYQPGMLPNPYIQAPPSTPVRSFETDRDPRVRQMSDISSVAGSVAAGSVNGLPVVYPSPALHPHYGLIYPPTPGSMGSMPPPQAVYQQDPRVWVDPYRQMQRTIDAALASADGVPERPGYVSQRSSSVPDAAAHPAAHHASTRAPRHNSLPDTLEPVRPGKSGKAKKRVSFSRLQIRTYETILGDNPSCSGGPSLGLGWRYDPSHYTATVDEYEAHQQRLYGGPNGEPYEPRPEDLVLHRVEREAILLNTGYTRQDMADSVRALNRVKNRRRQTVHNLPVAFVEERAEAVRRTLRRWVTKKERTRHMYEDWKKRSVAAEGRRGSA